jgi:hypothetical protein
MSKKNLALFSESSYPGGGGEEFMLDIAMYFYNKDYKIFWFSLHDWGISIHYNFEQIETQYYTHIKTPKYINDLANYDYYLNLFKQYNINYIFHQGQGHKLICDISNSLNIPAITQWNFWEEVININPNYGLINIKNNLGHHNSNNDFLYIIQNIDYYYVASNFVKNVIENKYNIQIDDKHIFQSLPSNRSDKNPAIDSYYSQYITLLDAHTLKGGVLFAELIRYNSDLSFLAIKTEDENNGPNTIQNAINDVNNGSNILYYDRFNNINEIYDKTKILLCPTQLDETFCRVVYEAFKNRIPVIFSNCGNLSYINNDNLLRINDNNPGLYNNKIQELKNKEYYDFIVEQQYQYYLTIKNNNNIEIIENKFLEIEKNKNKNIGIFTPWCDQGLGIQSRIYKKLFEKMGYNIYIFSTRPYIKTSEENLINNIEEWKTDRIYYSPNRRYEISNLELDLFVKNYRIKKFIIPEVQYNVIFDMVRHLKNEHNVLSYAIPNIEIVRNIDLNKFYLFEKVLTNNYISYCLLKNNNINNLECLGFHYDITDTLKINNINYNKCVTDKIHILHLSGLNGLSRKRTDIIINIFNNIYNNGFTDFVLNIIIQGNFDNTNDIFNKPFINLIFKHLSYTEILNIYNENHISIQISKHEGLGLGFYESCFMNTPVITLNAAPHNEVIHHNQNGWLLSCYMEKDQQPENEHSIIEQAQINEEVLENEIRNILSDKDNINNIIKDTKAYTVIQHSFENFKNNFIKLLG